MDLDTCLFVNLACQGKLPAKSQSFRTVSNAVHHQSYPACLLVELVAMLVACATSVLIGAAVGSVTGSLKHLQVNIHNDVKDGERDQFLMEWHSILDLQGDGGECFAPHLPFLFWKGSAASSKKN